MNLPFISPKPDSSRLCACKTVHLDHPNEKRRDGTVTHDLYGCRDEIRPEDTEAPARMFFIARDGAGVPSLWRDEGDRDPTCLFQKGQHGSDDDLWLLLTSHPDTQAAGFECGNCERFVIDNKPDDLDHLAEISRHRLGDCA